MPERYEQEIEEILGRTTELSPAPTTPRASLPRMLVSYAAVRLARSVSPGRVMVAGIVLIVLALVFRGFAPGLTMPLVVVGAVALLGSYALVVIRPQRAHSAPGQQKRWRGQLIDTEPDADESWWTRIRRGRR